MKQLLACAATLLLFCASAGAQTRILFVGNSFTYGANEPALSYNKADVTDLNGSHQGGVPGIFKKLTEQAGLSYDVSIEAAAGQTLAWHLAHKAALVGRSTWDVVVLQELSTGPLPPAHAGQAETFYASVRDLQKLVLAHNPKAKVFLYETWASPATVKTNGYSDLAAMQGDLRTAYFRAGHESRLQGVATVGDAFMRAVDQGLADAANGSTSGKLKLWSNDSRHASQYGSYLAAAVFLAKITGTDPRSLALGGGTAATELGLSASEAAKFHRIAYEVAAVPESSSAQK